jgi:hypothetical protein
MSLHDVVVIDYGNIDRQNSSAVERRFCKSVAVGSIPTFGFGIYCDCRLSISVLGFYAEARCAQGDMANSLAEYPSSLVLMWRVRFSLSALFRITPNIHGFLEQANHGTIEPQLALTYCQIRAASARFFCLSLPGQR